MDLQKIKKEYEKSRSPDLDKKKWAVMELIRIWLAHGIGNNKTRIRDTNPRWLNTHTRAMLNRLERHWFEFLGLIDANDKDLFKSTIKERMPDLYKIWNA